MPRHPSTPEQEYFLQQAKLFKHLEKRYTKFNNKAAEENKRARDSRNGHSRKTAAPTTPVKKDKKKKSKKDTQASTPSSDSDSGTSTSTLSTTTTTTTATDSSSMSGSIIRSTPRAFASALRPAVPTFSFTPAPSPAPFTTSAVTSAPRKKTKMKLDNPEALPALEAARVLRALEITRQSSAYSLTLSTKSPKGALPVRGTFVLPNDPRRTSETILVFAEQSSPSAALARSAGAAYVGAENLINPLLEGAIVPTRVLATPGMMQLVTSRLARFLGPKGLMPVAKRGGVAEGDELVMRIKEAAGSMDYRADKQGEVRVAVARLTFSPSEVEKNIRTFVDIVRSNASSGDDVVFVGGKRQKKRDAQITGVRLETTNGPSIELNDVL
ncbi:hypothetical protein IAT38_008325 [Cryptococcus sp. DSM 104549]